MEIEKLKVYIQSANINFLLGSGLSRPYLATLGNIEDWLMRLSRTEKSLNDQERMLLRASIYREYYNTVMLPNLDKSDNKLEDYRSTMENYKKFFMIWNEIINKRRNTLLPKQINLYSTNIDVFTEKAAEETRIEFNDGFKGSIKPIYDESNFQKSYRKTSLHFQNITEIPVFNYLKMHGGINWTLTDDFRITNDCSLNIVRSIKEVLMSIDAHFFVDLNVELKDVGNSVEKKKSDIIWEELIKRTRTIFKEISKQNDFDWGILNKFMNEYHKMIMINPTKAKFRETVNDLHFYELMRLYSNSLEKETSILFVMGFSFADEHIANITLRAANSNPTLLIYIFAHTEKDKEYYEKNLFKNNQAINNNIQIVTPENFNKKNQEYFKNRASWDTITNFDFLSINRVFEEISKMIPVSFNYGNRY